VPRASDHSYGMARKTRVVHFVGIGGIGMSGIAEVLLNLGYQVRGSDLKEGDVTKRLRSLGADVRIGHQGENVAGADVVVVSSAVRSTNPEVIAAREAKVPVIRRAEMLAELMRLKYGIAIGGTHGKTTTTSMVATVLTQAGLDPTVVVGGKINKLGTNAKLGQGPYLVAEADESDGSFLILTPTIAVITNIDPEHLDYYAGGMAEVRAAFASFANRIPFYGLAVLCADHPVVQALLPQIERRHTTYGLNPQAEYQGKNLSFDGPRTSFDLVAKGQPRGRHTIRMLGEHNVRNALATLAVADELGISPDDAREALESFDGVERRFTLRGQIGDVMVVDDYGHHPEEIRVTLDGARRAYPDRRILVAFQPHRYTRTRDLVDDFSTAFHQADRLWVCPIYSAGEEPIEGVSSDRLVERIRERGHRAVTLASGIEDVASRIAQEARDGDLIMTFGAGDITRAGPIVLDQIRARRGGTE
jgi:UDP-N-acetylmuramate--alanine ligase